MRRQCALCPFGRRALREKDESRDFDLAAVGSQPADDEFVSRMSVTWSPPTLDGRTKHISQRKGQS